MRERKSDKGYFLASVSAGNIIRDHKLFRFGSTEGVPKAEHVVGTGCDQLVVRIDIQGEHVSVVRANTLFELKVAPSLGYSRDRHEGDLAIIA